MAVGEEREEKILDEIRKQVLSREKELSREQNESDNLEATLQALEEITSVPRSEMEQIAKRIQSAHNPQQEKLKSAVVFYEQDHLPASVRAALKKLPPILQEEYFEIYQVEKRSLSISFLLWLIPPPFSSHHLYLGKWIQQIFFSLTAGGVYLWWIVDLFHLREKTEIYNRYRSKAIMKQLLRNNWNDANPPKSALMRLDRFLGKIKDKLRIG